MLLFFFITIKLNKYVHNFSKCHLLKKTFQMFRFQSVELIFSIVNRSNTTVNHSKLKKNFQHLNINLKKKYKLATKYKNQKI